jgi:acetyl esterase/lipase
MADPSVRRHSSDRAGGPRCGSMAPKGRSHSGALLVAVCSTFVALLASACRVNQNNIWAVDKVSPAWVAPTAPTLSDVAYGPLEAQKLDVWLPSGTPVGTLVYFHSGGWVGGDKANVSSFVLAELDRGWAVVSVDHRLAGTDASMVLGADDEPSTTVEAPQIMADADRAVRYVKANAASLGVDPGTIVAAGSSAGGWIAAMLATRPGSSVDPTLPPELAAQSPAVDALVDLVGPTDLTTFYRAGGWAAGLEEVLLGCEPEPDEQPVPPMTTCTEQLEQRWSPLTWAAVSLYLGIPLKPAYLGYGMLDGLVVPSTQGDPFHTWLGAAAGDLAVWYDLTPNEGHNVDHQLNKTAFDLWLNKVILRAW